MNLARIFSNTAAKYPQQTALVASEGRYTYQELEDRAAALAGAMLEAGLRPGDRVGLLFYNGAPLVETYFAALRVGLVATPLNFRLAAGELLYLLNHSGAKALFHGPEFNETLASIRDRLQSVEMFVSPGAAPDWGRDHEGFLQGGKWTDCSSKINEDSPCQLMYTSGTTGRPKGALLSHRNVIWNLYNTLLGREDMQGQVAIIVGPLYHTAALNNHLTIQLALGGTSIVMRKFEPEDMLKTIEREKATLISGSPAMYNLLMQHPAAERYDRGSIIKCTAGSDKLAMATKEQLMAFFPGIDGIYDVYGCTEASPCITILAARDSLRKDLSVGRALPFLNPKVAGPQGEPLPPGQTGEILVQGPNVMSGYFNDPQGSAEALRDGWLHTGDLAVVDEEGFFYIVDRKKDMIVSGGENIYPREVEEVLFSHPAVADAAVVGMPDPLWGESVRAFVVLGPGPGPDQEEIIAYVKSRLASYKKPKRVDFIADIPRNASGKALKGELRKLPLD